MANIVVLGAGISGHTAAMHVRRLTGKKHNVTVISPNRNFQWVPSNIWVGVGRMKSKQVKFELEPVYKKVGIQFINALALSIHPEGSEKKDQAFVTVQYFQGDKKNKEEEIPYDYLINATGPKLNFEATQGLGPEKFTQSVCSYDHAEKAWIALSESIEKMKNGQKQKIVIGTGHPMATCQGAAFEYSLNVAYEIKKRNLEHMAEITWISNEYELGDFGMSGAFVKRGGYVTPTKIFTESIFREYGVSWIKRAGVTKVTKNTIYYETLAGEEGELTYDFAMLIPGFTGSGLKAFDSTGKDITSVLFNPGGFMKVDADYTPKDFNEWKIEDWPSIYQNPDFDNIFAIGIAFAPPHPISKPMKSPKGTSIFPSPPRTGMPSGVMGKIVAQNISELVKGKKKKFRHHASMGKMGAACIISAGYGFFRGTAASMTVFPIVPDWEKYPDYGRDINYTVGEAGLAGHWIKLLLHYTFLYKHKGKPFWWAIPE